MKGRWRERGGRERGKEGEMERERRKREREGGGDGERGGSERERGKLLGTLQTFQIPELTV